jgi:hypothetical protein
MLSWRLSRRAKSDFQESNYKLTYTAYTENEESKVHFGLLT